MEGLIKVFTTPSVQITGIKQDSSLGSWLCARLFPQVTFRQNTAGISQPLTSLLTLLPDLTQIYHLNITDFSLINGKPHHGSVNLEALLTCCTGIDIEHFFQFLISCNF